MKRLLLTCFAALVPVLSLLAGQDHIEIGSLTTKGGIRLVVEYVVLKDAYREVHLIWPDGHEIKVDVEPGTSAKTLDRTLQQIADEQK